MALPPWAVYGGGFTRLATASWTPCQAMEKAA